MDNIVLTITVLFITYVYLINTIKTEADDDSVAMLKLASSLHGAPKGWSNKTGSNFCNWEGVKCNESSNRVTGIDLSNRNLEGTLPPELSTFSQLRNLSFKGNQLSGALPSLANLSFLQELHLGNNAFTSIPPDFFQGLTSLQNFNISQNKQLSFWHLPLDLANCTSLVSLDASRASVLGTIPDVFSSLRSLRDLDLSYNNLNGTLPSSFANSAIQNLRLDSYYDPYTGYEGTIDVLASMTQLKEARVIHNYFTGQIPDFSNCKNLSRLNLFSNFFTGLIPDSLASHPTLRILSLSENYLQGPIPQFPSHMKVTLDNNSFCNDTLGAPCDPVVTTFVNIAGALHYPYDLAQYWKGNNACSFEKLVTCDTQQRVITVNLESQCLVGTISQDFCNLTDLRNLTLNDNNLTGSVPDCLTKLPNLQMIDVSNNSLSGALPKFPSSVTVHAENNHFLTTPPHSQYRPHNPPNVPQKSSNGRKKFLLIAGVTVAGFLSVMAFALSICLFKKRITKSVNGREYCINEAGILSHVRSRDNGEARNTAISFKFLQQVTDNFSEVKMLGRGGSGVVYKGELNDGTCIAVKRMETTNELKGFEAEIKVLTRVRHRRLVALLGYSINHNEKILVYEYMPRGTLRQHLFEWREHDFLPLTWMQRITIALDVARGVEYLHSLARETFIHRDLKPSNILLGDDMRAKVSDFGLVKRTSNGRYSTETKVAGTFGYFAPEYAATGKVTTKVDVYAYGVILMEMITGRKAVDETASEDGWMSMHLVTWFRSLLTKKEDIASMIDKTLHPDKETLLSIIKVAKLAGHCCSSKPNQRPHMSHVVNILACLVEQWTPPSPED